MKTILPMALICIVFTILFSVTAFAHPYPEYVYGSLKFTVPVVTPPIPPGGGGIGDVNITEPEEEIPEEPDILEKPVEEIIDEKIEEAKEWVTAQIGGLASAFGINPAMVPIFILGIIFLIFVLYEETKKRKDEDEI